MPEYRPVPEADTDAYRRVLDYSFRAEAGPDPDHEDDPPFIGDRRALYDGDVPVTTAVRLPLTVTVRGDWHDTVGLSAVATLPEHRRQGRVRQLLRESLAESQTDGVPFSLLWPFKHAFYRRLGWGRIADHGQYEFDPSTLEPLDDHRLAGGGFRRLGPDDFAELQAVDARYADRFDLTMRRTESWYRHRFFEGWETEPFVYGWTRDGDLAGYLRYDVEPEDDDRVLRVLDLGAPDAASAVNLYRFLYRHDNQADRIQLFAPPDDRLFDLGADPRDVELTIKPGAMGRLVDVTESIERLAAPADVEAAVTVTVDDGLCDWNDGAFTVEASGGAFAVRSADGDDAEASLPIETLSRLAFGSLSAERAALAGGLRADDEAIDRLDELFPPRENYLREFF